jgi:hypothetical protein
VIAGMRPVVIRDGQRPFLNVVASAFMAVTTGSRSTCVSAFGGFDMVGNLLERVANWAPLSMGACPGGGGFSNNVQCFAGADTVTPGGPGAPLRGGCFFNGVPLQARSK